MRSLKNTQAVELDSTLLANELLMEFDKSPEFDEQVTFTPQMLDKINRASLATVKETEKFTEQMLQIMEFENYDLEDCAPPLDEGEPAPCIDIPIKSLFDKLSDYVCVVLAS